MKLKELITKSRSYRRFFEEVPISKDQLVDFIDHARLSPSARNGQVMKYIISNDKNKNELIFHNLAWAGYLKDWDGPEPGERPSAYIIMLADTSLSNNYFCDDGIAAQSIMLAATEAGYGGCIIAAIKRDKLQKELNIDNKFKIVLVLALGKPKETVVIEEINQDGEFKYWRDEDNVHHVPKRNIDEIIINNPNI